MVNRLGDQAYAEELGETFELDSLQKIKTLSKGQRARTALLVALAHRPETNPVPVEEFYRAAGSTTLACTARESGVRRSEGTCGCGEFHHHALGEFLDRPCDGMP